jgi:glucose-1-phosphate adenylyltransferase
VGTIRSFFDSNLDLIEPTPRIHFFDEPFKIFTHARFLPGSKVWGLEAKSSLICEGCIIEEARLKKALIGVRTIIGKGAFIENTYVMGADYYEDDPEAVHPNARTVPPVGIGEDTFISGAIVDKNARIGRGVKITAKEPGDNYSGPGFMVKDGITVIEKDAVIPDDTVI